jgi:polyhydroxyalkanoate synthesis regulator phasin
LIFFAIAGFFIGFFLKINSKKGKTQLLKMEKDADANQSRITALKEKIEELEKQNRALGGTNSFS